ncbi:unnamed protein product [Echinostoma caproni]|uniref:Uncharacterized protein n=1 Tax=Echinostoma caproni TaxID=27848 RepID=A0A183AUX2_9TREM|nr:unnamed protein product [Echinostoma caproni]
MTAAVGNSGGGVGGGSNSGTPLTTALNTPGTPTKTPAMLTRATSGSVASPRRSQTPSTSSTTAVSVRGCVPDVNSPQPALTTQFAPEPDLGDANRCSGESELTCLTRHLIMCLCVLGTQIPLLGRMSLFMAEELEELRPSVQLVFSTPSLEDNSPQLTFGVLITLAHSLSYLFLKVSRYIRTDSPATKSVCELSALLAQAHEMTVAIMLSQATLILLHERTSSAEKQLLVRELTSELKSCNLLGRSSRRRHSLGHRSSHSPSSRSSSTARALQRATSPHVPSTTTAHSTSVAAAAAADLHSVGTKLTGPDLGGFGFEQAIDRFSELLRLSI